MVDDRLGWDRYFLGIAEAVSVRGDCTRSRVGAVIVDRNRIVVSTGYNGHEAGGKSCLKGECPRGRKSYDEIPPGADYKDPGAPCEAVHAEDNAIRYARHAGQVERLKGGTIYITRQPCADCELLIASAGLYRVFWPQEVKLIDG